MSLAALRKIVAANPDVPDAGFAYVTDCDKYGRVLACVIVQACDEIPIEKLDRKAKDIRLGSANVMREQSTEEKRETCVVIVPIGYLRHLVSLAGG